MIDELKMVCRLVSLLSNYCNGLHVDRLDQRSATQVARCADTLMC